MRVFLTGASGWIGSATVDELSAAGHEVVGLARSATAAAALEGKGAKVIRGDLDDLAALRRGARESDGVVHLANKHDWSDPAGTNRTERAAITTLADELAGSGRAFVHASVLSGLVRGRAALESDPSPAVGEDSPRGGAENLAREYIEKDVRVVSARFAPSVHGVGDPGFVRELVAAARRHGVSAYIGDGAAAWAAVPRAEAARALRLGLEGAPAGTRMHVVAEEAISTHSIAEAIGHTLGLPVASIEPATAGAHFGFVGRFFGLDMSASSERTRELLDWQPAGPTLLEHIAAGAYTLATDA
ncbi:NAD-dependent epimerase/dehydratase family protein [Nocardia inohanensis]|uniref:NAD-dependent epimerase/dehydratase family protein n=1 Tax=Nocardia inohanensis TaxID=209246 RepID=UPI00082C86ED|nr:NAD-dependent epimerase/dehydratase family protein [Nocardia inohanensis]